MAFALLYLIKCRIAYILVSSPHRLPGWPTLTALLRSTVHYAGMAPCRLLVFWRHAGHTIYPYPCFRKSRHCILAIAFPRACPSNEYHFLMLGLNGVSTPTGVVLPFFVDLHHSPYSCFRAFTSFLHTDVFLLVFTCYANGTPRWMCFVIGGFLSTILSATLAQRSIPPACGV